MRASLRQTAYGTVVPLLLLLGVVPASFETSNLSLKVNPYISAEKVLWREGDASVKSYRIPLLSYTPKGHLLAVAEARKYSTSDAGPKFLVVRRSLDKFGDQWAPQQVVVDDGYLIFDGINLGAVIVDDEKGAIFIMYSICNHHDQCNVTSTMLVKSYDDGVSWTKGEKLLGPGTWMFSPGPGFGIQKKYAPNKGRLIVCGHGSLDKDGLYCLLSDDHGATWRWGGSVIGLPFGLVKQSGDFLPDECQLVELMDGSILVNIRNQNSYHCHCRMVTRSYDGAETFPMENLYLDETLIEPACAAGMVYHKNVLFFSNPKSTTERVDLNLRWSYDNGTTWADEYQIWNKASGYSTMTAHPGSMPYIFILFEKGILSYFESLTFLRVSLFEDV
ncbi:sialidase-1-like [Asterias rubens]|uniref:sialidase-1-like n=1 Tax=Asterias rubens TaxID=7604 RepID=UPI001454F74E|nr:sialidase-1-like [Asterias rubens]